MNRAQPLQHCFQNTILSCPRLSESSMHGWSSREEFKTGQETECEAQPKGDPSFMEQQLEDSQYILDLQFLVIKLETINNKL